MGEPLGLGLEETPDRGGADPRLNDEQRARLRAVGKLRSVEPGEVLFREGEADYGLFVVESGAVTIVQGYGHENRVVCIHGRRRFLGELTLLTGAAALVTAVVRDAGEVIQVPREGLAEIAAEDEDLANLLLRSLLARRWIMVGLGAGLKLVGSRFSSDTWHRATRVQTTPRRPDSTAHGFSARGARGQVRLPCEARRSAARARRCGCR